MSRWFSPWNLVERSAVLDGVVSLEKLPDLTDKVMRADALNYRIVGQKDVSGKAQLALDVTGLLNIQCERCLEAMPFELDCHSTLGVLTPVAAATRSGEHELTDDCDVVVVEAEDKLNAFDLLQDEILLALPLISAHENVADCSTEVQQVFADSETEPALAPEEEASHKPFAGLADLLGKGN